MWQCKWCHLVAKFTTNASSAIWWPNLQPKQVTPSGGQIQPMHVASSGGQVYIQCKWSYLVLTKKKIKKIGWETYGPNTPGLMCLWQCFAMSFGSQPGLSITTQSEHGLRQRWCTLATGQRLEPFVHLPAIPSPLLPSIQTYTLGLHQTNFQPFWFSAEEHTPEKLTKFRSINKFVVLWVVA